MKYKLSEVKTGSNVIIMPNCVIGRPPLSPKGTTMIDYSKLEQLPVIIEDNSVIGANTVIYNNVHIGKNCLIGDGVHIREGVVIGDNCIIGIGVKVGARTTIDNNTKIMDLSNVASDAYLGQNVFVGPGVMMGNDNKMGREIEDLSGFGFSGPNILDFATIGMNSTILPGINVGADSTIAAGSVVTKNVPDYAIVMGIPAKVVSYLDKEKRRV